MDTDFTIAEALSVTGGCVSAVGSEAAVLATAGPETQICGLGGKTILPGFIEAHGHPTAEMNFIGPDMVDIRASVCGSAAAVLKRLHDAIDAAERAGGDAWVAAFGWDPLLLPELPQISGDFLTQISPVVPVSVMHYSAHSSWANAEAMDRLGIDRSTPDPGASQYLRDAQGRPTGEGKEIPACMTLMGPNASAGPADFDAFLAHELQRTSAAGITTTGDLAFHPDDYARVAAFMASCAAPVRIRSYEMSGVREEVPPPGQDPVVGAGTDMLRPVGVKVWTDGSPWIGNIETSFGYKDSNATRRIGLEGGHRGCSNYSREQLLAICRRDYAKGWQMACHVHGDVAVDMVLDVFAQVQAEFPRPDGRLRMEHCGTITPEQVQRAANLGVCISFFVAHIHYYGNVLVELFGERAEDWTPAGAAVAAGMKFSLHNDPPVTPESPLLNMQTAMTRATASGQILGARHAIGIEDAIRAQTIHAAWQLFSEHEVGSLEPGKFADLVILDENPLEVEPSRVGDIRIAQTWLSGVKMFDGDAGPALPHLPLSSARQSQMAFSNG
ncbi:amidohydrolase [Arthrobacter sp. STN4]|uniref:amidohydrolase n=1 Tax=Arthrobacter sp. STN4 TaxID=2923276 RepID=UPI002119DB85|nr:amidohydrolase [Arthrobacter sp. STN4]MCQ9165960.1 amidohydrolase [Arthrobacter sp. STN4]